MIHGTWYTRTWYTRTLRLRRIQPGSATSAVLLEGVIVLAILLALAELVPWPVIVILPIVVAAGLKLGDEALVIASRRSKAPRSSQPEDLRSSGTEASCAGTLYRSAAISSDVEIGQTKVSALTAAAVGFPMFAIRRSRWTHRCNAPDARSVGGNQRQSIWVGPHTETPPQR